MRAQLDINDEKDMAILKARAEARRCRTEPLVGDWVIFPNGEGYRLTYDWGDSMQTTDRDHPGDVGSFYLEGNGLADYSGSLDPSIPKDKLHLRDESMPAWFWFFHHGEARAHNGVSFPLLVKVWEYRP